MRSIVSTQERPLPLVSLSPRGIAVCIIPTPSTVVKPLVASTVLVAEMHEDDVLTLPVGAIAAKVEELAKLPKERISLPHYWIFWPMGAVQPQHSTDRSNDIPPSPSTAEVVSTPGSRTIEL
ncbi:hypothetical protein V5O48_013552 [Marasmius crinis-equi]|uniref:Uncharacterized protein n=1 Tax=Marasmius crinis-equi TaxID=585013 RepID=A0ABR3F052_9AGAR